jgi:hypothetical protein
MAGSPKDSNAIIHAQSQEIVLINNALVERGLSSLSLLEINDDQVQQLRSKLNDCNFDIRAEALKAISRIGTAIRSSRRYADAIIVPLLLHNLYDYFGPNLDISYQKQMDLFSHGKHYPPDEDYLCLLLSAIESLGGSRQRPYELIMETLYYGSQKVKIEVLEWLVKINIPYYLEKEISKFLEESIKTLNKNDIFSLSLWYAHARINNKVDECLHYLVAEIILEPCEYELKETARNYVLSIIDFNEPSDKVLFDMLYSLAESDYNELALEIINNKIIFRDPASFSDEDLEFVYYFISKKSEEDEEMEELEEEFKKELQRRGLV